MTTDQKGAIAEMAIASAAIKLGVEVYKPLAEGGRYDLIFDLDPQLVRVQCKWATRYGDIVVVRCYSCRRTRAGMLKRVYSKDEVDVIAAYCLEIDRCFVFPAEIFHLRTAVQLRLAPARNNQRRKINWADDFDFAARLRDPQGAVAQLGERLPGRQ